MTAPRVVVVQCWAGHQVVARLLSPDEIDAMPDGQVATELMRLGIKPMPVGEDARRERLLDFPTLADLDAYAVAWLPWNDGVKPTVRVLEAAVGFGRGIGPAGSVPRSSGRAA